MLIAPIWVEGGAHHTGKYLDSCLNYAGFQKKTRVHVAVRLGAVDLVQLVNEPLMNLRRSVGPNDSGLDSRVMLLHHLSLD